jgi:hypothetical protein
MTDTEPPGAPWWIVAAGIIIEVACVLALAAWLMA